MEYKGFKTVIRYIAESNTYRGIIENIDDYVDFEADSALKAEKEFHYAVDDYIEFCREVGKKPIKRRE